MSAAIRVLVTACLVTLSATSTGAAVTFSRIADTTTPIPAGTGNFTGFRTVMLSGEHVAFRGSGTSSQAGTHLARWQRVDHVESLKGEKIRLKFYLRNAEVFSFWFE